jgi:3-(3-hydroxy-phenyl)propionate hydroxylase
MIRTETIPVWKSFGCTPRAGRAPSEAHETLIVGGGPIGLALALDLGRKGRKVVLVNALPFIARASKAICFSKRSLEIFDRLGVGERLVRKGVVWSKGKVFWKGGKAPIYEFDLLPIKDQKFPAFINIQQYYVEEFLLDEIARYDTIDIRWGHELIAIDVREDRVIVEIRTPEEQYRIETAYLLACDGNKSTVRTLLGLDFAGRAFEDNFLIADVKFSEERPAERWFHFDPPWPGASSLIHKQPDGVWRLDFQLGPNIDRKEAAKPEYAAPFVRGMLGPDVDFEFEWLSVYTFQCRRMARFLHDRVIFAGDAAHLVSPFGARGCNGGLQDADNLAWKLDLVLDGRAPSSLLESYNSEAITVADVNIMNSTRSTDFMTPKSTVARLIRDAVLELARDHDFARPFVNSGRLSQAVPYAHSPLSTPDDEAWTAGPEPGATATDAPLGEGKFLLECLGDRFTLVDFTDVENGAYGVDVLRLSPRDEKHRLAAARYGCEDGGAYLVRPDQHVAARWRKPDAARVRRALARASGKEMDR